MASPGNRRTAIALLSFSHAVFFYNLLEFYTRQGKDATAMRLHVTIAVPNATAASLGIPDNNKMGGAYIMGAGTTAAHIMTPGS